MRSTQLQAYFELPMIGANRAAVLQLLFEMVPALLPARWSADEETWFNLDAQVGEVLADRPNFVILESKPAWNGYVGEGLPWAPRGLLWLGFNPDKIPAEDVAAFARALPTVAAVRHVLVHAVSENDRALSTIYDRPAFGENDDPEQAQLLFKDSYFNDKIPELWWGQVLSGDLVTRFELGRLATLGESVPDARAEQLTEDSWWVQVTASPADPLADWPSFHSARQLTKAHLGSMQFAAG